MTTPVTTTSIRQVALAAHDAGLCVVPPAQDGTKRPLGEWQQYQRRRPTREQVEAWYSRNRAGLGIVQGKVSGCLETMEFDDYPTYIDFKADAEAAGLGELVKRIESGYSERSPSGGVHWPYYCSEIQGNTKLARRPKTADEMGGPGDKVKVLIETRGEGGYLIVAPSHGAVHPTGLPYTVLAGSLATIATISPEERRDLWALARTFDQTTAGTTDVTAVRLPVTATGGRPGDDYNARADWGDLLVNNGWTHVYTRDGVDYWRRPGKDRDVSATTNHQDSDLLYVFSTSTEFESERGYNKFSVYALLEHGGDFQQAAKALAESGYGEQSSGADARISVSTPTTEDTTWPKPMAPEAYYGLAGDVVRGIEPHTEADPSALLVNFLVYFGNAVGNGPHASAEAARHGTNLDVVLVGETAKGRKGSSRGHIHELFKRVDPTWTDTRIWGGMSSGEGLIWAVRNPIEKTDAIKERGRHTGEYETTIIDQGVTDKRLLVYEPEWASVLRVMSRDSNTLSTQIRQAWDSGTLRTMTKNNPAVATGAHISILGHITKDELLRYLTDVEAGNGFGNRILWICTRRAQVLPEGGGTPDYSLLVQRLHDALEQAKIIGRIERDTEAKIAWAAVYEELSDGKPGLFGAITARAEAQVLRLTVLYAVMDGSLVISLPHLKAAMAVWEYAEASAQYIFGNATGDPIADRILTALRHGEMTRTAISYLFQKNVSATRIQQALNLLLSAKRARFEMRSGDGKPVEVWMVI